MEFLIAQRGWQRRRRRRRWPPDIVVDDGGESAAFGKRLLLFAFLLFSLAVSPVDAALRDMDSDDITILFRTKQPGDRAWPPAENDPGSLDNLAPINWYAKSIFDSSRAPSIISLPTVMSGPLQPCTLPMKRPFASSSVFMTTAMEGNSTLILCSDQAVGTKDPGPYRSFISLTSQNKVNVYGYFKRPYATILQRDTRQMLALPPPSAMSSVIDLLVDVVISNSPIGITTNALSPPAVTAIAPMPFGRRIYFSNGTNIFRTTNALGVPLGVGAGNSGIVSIQLVRSLKQPAPGCRPNVLALAFENDTLLWVADSEGNPGMQLSRYIVDPLTGDITHSVGLFILVDPHPVVGMAVIRYPLSRLGTGGATFLIVATSINAISINTNTFAIKIVLTIDASLYDMVSLVKAPNFPWTSTISPSPTPSFSPTSTATSSPSFNKPNAFLRNDIVVLVAESSAFGLQPPPFAYNLGFRVLNWDGRPNRRVLMLSSGLQSCSIEPYEDQPFGQERPFTNQLNGEVVFPASPASALAPSPDASTRFCFLEGQALQGTFDDYPYVSRYGLSGAFFDFYQFYRGYSSGVGGGNFSGVFEVAGNRVDMQLIRGNATSPPPRINYQEIFGGSLLVATRDPWPGGIGEIGSGGRPHEMSDGGTGKSLSLRLLDGFQVPHPGMSPLGRDPLQFVLSDDATQLWCLDDGQRDSGQLFRWQEDQITGRWTLQQAVVLNVELRFFALTRRMQVPVDNSNTVLRWVFYAASRTNVYTWDSVTGRVATKFATSPTTNELILGISIAPFDSKATDRVESPILDDGTPAYCSDHPFMSFSDSKAAWLPNGKEFVISCKDLKAGTTNAYTAAGTPLSLAIILTVSPSTREAVVYARAKVGGTRSMGALAPRDDTSDAVYHVSTSFANNPTGGVHISQRGLDDGGTVVAAGLAIQSTTPSSTYGEGIFESYRDAKVFNSSLYLLRSDLSGNGVYRFPSPASMPWNDLIEPDCLVDFTRPIRGMRAGVNTTGFDLLTTISSSFVVESPTSVIVAFIGMNPPLWRFQRDLTRPSPSPAVTINDNTWIATASWYLPLNRSGLEWDLFGLVLTTLNNRPVLYSTHQAPLQGSRVYRLFLDTGEWRLFRNLPCCGSRYKAILPPFIPYAEPTPSPSFSSSSSVTPAAALSPSSSSSTSPSSSSSLTMTPSRSASATASVSPGASASATRSVAPTPSATSSPSSSASASLSTGATPSLSASPSVIPTASGSGSVSSSASVTASGSPSVSGSTPATSSASISAGASSSPSKSAGPSSSPSSSAAASPSPSNSVAATSSPSSSPSGSSSPSPATPSWSLSQSGTATGSASQTAIPSLQCATATEFKAVIRLSFDLDPVSLDVFFRDRPLTPAFFGFNSSSSSSSGPTPSSASNVVSSSAACLVRLSLALAMMGEDEGLALTGDTASLGLVKFNSIVSSSSGQSADAALVAAANNDTDINGGARCWNQASTVLSFVRSLQGDAASSSSRRLAELALERQRDAARSLQSGSAVLPECSAAGRRALAAGSGSGSQAATVSFNVTILERTGTNDIGCLSSSLPSSSQAGQRRRDRLLQAASLTPPGRAALQMARLSSFHDASVASGNNNPSTSAAGSESAPTSNRVFSAAALAASDPSGAATTGLSSVVTSDLAPCVASAALVPVVDPSPSSSPDPAAAAKKKSLLTPTNAALAIGFGVSVGLLIALAFLYWKYRRMVKKLREKHLKALEEEEKAAALEEAALLSSQASEGKADGPDVPAEEGKIPSQQALRVQGKRASFAPNPLLLAAEASSMAPPAETMTQEQAAAAEAAAVAANTEELLEEAAVPRPQSFAPELLQSAALQLVDLVIQELDDQRAEADREMAEIEAQFKRNLTSGATALNTSDASQPTPADESATNNSRAASVVNPLAAASSQAEADATLAALREQHRSRMARVTPALIQRATQMLTGAGGSAAAGAQPSDAAAFDPATGLAASLPPSGMASPLNSVRISPEVAKAIVSSALTAALSIVHQIKEQQHQQQQEDEEEDEEQGEGEQEEGEEDDALGLYEEDEGQQQQGEDGDVEGDGEEPLEALEITIGGGEDGEDGALADGPVQVLGPGQGSGNTSTSNRSLLGSSNSHSRAGIGSSRKLIKSAASTRSIISTATTKPKSGGLQKAKYELAPQVQKGTVEHKKEEHKKGKATAGENSSRGKRHSMARVRRVAMTSGKDVPKHILQAVVLSTLSASAAEVEKTLNLNRNLAQQQSAAAQKAGKLPPRPPPRPVSMARPPSLRKPPSALDVLTLSRSTSSSSNGSSDGGLIAVSPPIVEEETDPRDEGKQLLIARPSTGGILSSAALEAIRAIGNDVASKAMARPPPPSFSASSPAVGKARLPGVGASQRELLMSPEALERALAVKGARTAVDSQGNASFGAANPLKLRQLKDQAEKLRTQSAKDRVAQRRATLAQLPSFGSFVVYHFALASAKALATLGCSQASSRLMVASGKRGQGAKGGHLAVIEALSAASMIDKSDAEKRKGQASGQLGFTGSNSDDTGRRESGIGSRFRKKSLKREQEIQLASYVPASSSSSSATGGSTGGTGAALRRATMMRRGTTVVTPSFARRTRTTLLSPSIIAMAGGRSSSSSAMPSTTRRGSVAQRLADMTGTAQEDDEDEEASSDGEGKATPRPGEGKDKGKDATKKARTSISERGAEDRVLAFRPLPAMRSCSRQPQQQQQQRQQQQQPSVARPSIAAPRMSMAPTATANRRQTVLMMLESRPLPHVANASGGGDGESEMTWTTAPTLPFAPASSALSSGGLSSSASEVLSFALRTASSGANGVLSGEAGAAAAGGQHGAGSNVGRLSIAPLRARSSGGGNARRATRLGGGVSGFGSSLGTAPRSSIFTNPLSSFASSSLSSEGESRRGSAKPRAGSVAGSTAVAPSVTAEDDEGWGSDCNDPSEDPRLAAATATNTPAAVAALPSPIRASENDASPLAFRANKRAPPPPPPPPSPISMPARQAGAAHAPMPQPPPPLMAVEAEPGEDEW